MLDSWGAEREGTRGRACSDPTGIKTSVPSCPKAGKASTWAIWVRWLRKIPTKIRVNQHSWLENGPGLSRCISCKNVGGVFHCYVSLSDIKGFIWFCFLNVYIFRGKENWKIWEDHISCCSFWEGIIFGKGVWDHKKGYVLGLKKEVIVCRNHII